MNLRLRLTLARAERASVLTVLLICVAPRVGAQTVPPAADSRHSMLREAMLGILGPSSSVPATLARKQCLDLPVDPPNDRLQGPHGDSVVSTRCEVIAFAPLDRGSPPHWMSARYVHTSMFTAEDTSRGPAARDTVMEEEVVLLDASEPDKSRPVWHARFETGGYAVWRSVTPELGPASGGTLLSVMSCVNGTGGCGQEFLRRHSDGRWFPVWQVWLDQLPRGFPERIRHGVRIDPATLRGEAGFYGDRDPNCCPSKDLVVHLALQGDSLVLQRQVVRPAPSR